MSIALTSRAVRSALELGLAAGAAEGARHGLADRRRRRPRQAVPEREGVRVPAGPGLRRLLQRVRGRGGRPLRLLGGDSIENFLA